MKFTHTVTTEITNENIDNQIDAGFSGISYWCTLLSVEKRPENPEGLALSQYVTRGGILRLEVDEEETFTLDMAAAQKGLAIMAEKYPTSFAEVAAEEGDAYTGDIFIQCCIFGEVVYG